MLETFAKDFDIKLLSWKEQIEKDVKKERQILAKLSVLDPNAEEEIISDANKLEKYRESMHPSYSFAEDNVDFIIKPRQMMKSKQNKDFHMFQNVAYVNRISPNNLGDDQPIVDVDRISWLTFLPSAMEQTSLTE